MILYEVNVINDTVLNEYGQNIISFSYFNMCLLGFHCINNIENIHFTPIYFKTVPTEHTEIINDNLRDKLRRLNNSVIYLSNAVNGLSNYYFLMEQEKNNETKLIYENLYRQMCRNACVELFVYFEKIKSLIRYYFNFDKQATEKIEKFLKAIKTISGYHECIKELYDIIKEIGNDVKFKDIMSIRHDEIHNESKIDNIKYNFLPNSPNGLEVNNYGYFVSNSQLYDDIKYVLLQANKLRNSMQKIIDSLNRVAYYNLLKTKNI